MKKTLIAAAVMAASGVAFAASNVTLYGIIEEGVIVQKAKHGDNKVELNSGFGQGSRWGIKGVEDLGNGYSAGFVLEQGFNADNGNEATSGKAFSRESFLYVKGGFGSFGFGRTGALSFAQTQAILTGWAFGTSYGASSWQSAIANNFSRMDNVLSYATPVFDGFSGHVMYSNGLTSDSEKWSDNNHYYGIGVKYQANAIRSSLIFEAADNKSNYDLTNKSTTLQVGNKLIEKFTGLKDALDADDAADLGNAKFKAKTSYAITAGGAYNFGVVEAQGIYQYAWQSDFYKQHAFGLGIKAPVAGGTFGLGARMLLGKFDGTAKTILCKEDTDKYRAWNIGANYKYPLSKRTAVYGYAGYSDGAKWLKDVDSGKYNGWAVGTGLVHSF